jgi:uncharacterized delta-60 repeat protein
MFQRISIVASARDVLIASIFCAASALCTSITAQPLAPDLSFGGTGRVTVTLSAGASTDRHGLALAPDGKILIAGSCYLPSIAICVVRLLPNGTIDPAFAVNGKLSIPSNQYGGLVGVVLQRDEKILVTARCTYADTNTIAVCFRRFHANGAVDTSFGSSGLTEVILPDRSPYMSGRVTLSGDGKVVISGICSGFGDDQRFCAIRVLGNGTPDPNFGSNGVSVVAFPPNVYYQDRPTHVRQSDGKIVISGQCALQPSLAHVPCLSRLTEAGLIDESFGTLGYTVMSPAAVQTATEFTEARDLLLRPDGSFLLLNNYGNIFGKISLFAFTRDGALDLSFGTAGRQIHDVAGNSYSFRFEPQLDGRVIVFGNCPDVNFNSFACLSRFNADGTIDATFPISSTLPSALGFDTRMLMLQSDGKIVTAGTCNTGTQAEPLYEFCAARFNGGPLESNRCTADIDGDGVISGNDSLLLARVSLGLTGNAVTQGLTFAPHAARKSWIELRNYLFNHCAMAVSS